MQVRILLPVQFFSLLNNNTMSKQDSKKTTVNNAELVINTDGILGAAAIFRAIGHVLRLQIIKLIHSKKEVNVNVIYNTLKIEQSITSQHLKILREVNIVSTRRDGKKIYYSLDYDTFRKVYAAINILDIDSGLPF